MLHEVVQQVKIKLPVYANLLLEILTLLFQVFARHVDDSSEATKKQYAVMWDRIRKVISIWIQIQPQFFVTRHGKSLKSDIEVTSEGQNFVRNGLLPWVLNDE